MEQTYALWSAKLQGWMSRTGTYDSRLSEAQRYSRTDAIIFARKQKGDETFGLLPIALDDLEAI